MKIELVRLFVVLQFIMSSLLCFLQWHKSRLKIKGKLQKLCQWIYVTLIRTNRINNLKKKMYKKYCIPNITRRTYSARACHTDIAINRGQMDYTGTGFCTLCLRTCWTSAGSQVQPSHYTWRTLQTSVFTHLYSHHIYLSIYHYGSLNGTLVQVIAPS